jgi:DNA-binding response OmpR family regulator
LVIDDEPTIRTWLGKVLAGAGYEVLAASGDSEALAQASGRPVDLVISNLVGSGQERLETIRALRAERPQLRIVATAGVLNSDALRAADLLGAQAVLTKPLGSLAVVRRVRELLRSRPVPYVATEEPPKFPSTLRISR